MRLHGRTDVHNDDRTSRGGGGHVENVVNAARYEELRSSGEPATYGCVGEAKVGGYVP